MGKVVPDDQNHFRQVWKKAHEQGTSRQVVSDSLGIDRGRLNDLIIGRAKPTLGERTALSGRRKATLVRYHDDTGQRHSFYTGRGMSFERLVESGAIVDIAEEMSDDRDYQPFEKIVGLENRYPKVPQSVRIYPINRTLRSQLGRY